MVDASAIHFQHGAAVDGDKIGPVLLQQGDESAGDMVIETDPRFDGEAARDGLAHGT